MIHVLNILNGKPWISNFDLDIYQAVSHEPDMEELIRRIEKEADCFLDKTYSDVDPTTMPGFRFRRAIDIERLAKQLGADGQYLIVTRTDPERTVTLRERHYSKFEVCRVSEPFACIQHTPHLCGDTYRLCLCDDNFPYYTLDESVDWREVAVLVNGEKKTLKELSTMRSIITGEVKLFGDSFYVIARPGRQFINEIRFCPSSDEGVMVEFRVDTLLMEEG